MANKTAPYKNSELLGRVEEWWNHGEGDRLDLPDMFTDYTILQMNTRNYDAVMPMSDFGKCLYKLGVRRLGNGFDNTFVRARTYRPSDDMAMRFKGDGWL